MPKPLLVFLAPVVIAGVALTTVAAKDQRGLVASLAVNPLAVVADVRPEEELCQGPIRVSEPFARVRFQVGTYFRPGPALNVTIRKARSRTFLGRGHLAAGYPDLSRPAVLVGEIPAGRRVDVCIENVGDRRAALFGSGGDQLPTTQVTLDGRQQVGELTMSFYTADRPSALEEVPEIFRRASLFRPGIVGEWTFWMLAFVLILAVPLLLMGAMRSSFGEAARESPSGEHAQLTSRRATSEQRRRDGGGG